MKHKKKLIKSAKARVTGTIPYCHGKVPHSRKLLSLCSNPLKLWVWTRSWRGVLNTTLCDKFCQWLASVRWFSPGTPVSSTNKTDCHDISYWNIVESVVKHHNLNPNPHDQWCISALCKEDQQNSRNDFLIATGIVWTDGYGWKI
jgi:hypothetical protein